MSNLDVEFAHPIFLPYLMSCATATTATVDSKKSETLKKLTALTVHVLISVDITELTTSLNFFRAVWS